MGTGDDDEAAAPAAGESAREYFRVRADLPLRTEPLAQADYGRTATEILSHVEPELPDLDPALVGWLDRMERKLDYVLRHFDTSDRPDAVGWGNTTAISGSGLSFVPEHPIAPGTALILEIELPETPIRYVRCIGRVVEQGEGGDDAAAPREIGVAFETIRSNDRDAIVRTTLAIQRETIRLGGRNGDES